MKNYYQSLKGFSLLGAAALSLLFGTMTALAAGVHEYENPPCYDVTGATTAVLVGGVANGGVMDFDDTGVSAGAQACVRMKDVGGGVMVPDRLEGWVWNSNLGWVSLYCPGGGGALNLGYACGSQAYSVTFNATPAASTPDFTNVTMSGYAWGDNIGYISFNSAYHQMKPTASGMNRGLVGTGFPATDKDAWTDTVGWLDFGGVRFFWFDSDPPMPGPALDYVNVCAPNDLKHAAPFAVGESKCNCDLDSTCGLLTDQARVPDADGASASGYYFDVGFVDAGVKANNTQLRDCAADTINMYQSGSDGYAYCGRIAITWEDDVDFDQTTAASQSQATPKFNASNAGPVQKAFTMTPDFTYDAVDQEWKARIYSAAPTSESNATTDMQNEKFYYSNVTGYDGTKTSQNQLKIKEIKLLMYKYSIDGISPGYCIYGNVVGSDCTLRNYASVSGSTVSFKPMYNVTAMDFFDGSKLLKYINILSPESLQRFDWTAVWNPVKISNIVAIGYLGLQNGGVFEFKFDPSALNTTSLPVSSGVPESVYGKLSSTEPGAAITADAGPYLYTKISYQVAGQVVTYFANKLPRIKAGLLLNPVAKVQGNVYVTDFAQKAADVSLRSLGNISSNLKREQILRNVSKFTRGKTIPGGDAAPSDTQINVTSLTSPVAGGLTELVSGKVYYVKGSNLSINCGGDCTLSDGTKKTFIVENGSVFVNSNIIASNGSQIGLIALRNLEGDKQNEGFVFFDAPVTWLSNVHVYADRLVQSYRSAGLNIYDTTGLYAGDSVDDYGRPAFYANQLVFEGTIASMNGIGNASRSPATDENGAGVAAGSYCSTYGIASDMGETLAGICRARLVDLNYMRYYGPGLETCTGSEGPGAVANVPRDQKLKASGTDPANGCDPAVYGDGIDATQLYDAASAPDADLVAGGGSGTKSEYYTSKGIATSLANEYPVNFFYKPIAKDLPGFEVEQSYNPTNQ